MAQLNDPDELAAELQSLRKQAQELGLFTDDRELLVCPPCGLKEGVTFEGYLYTYRGEATRLDTGLRFPEPDENGVSTCPVCGGEVKSEWL